MDLLYKKRPGTSGIAGHLYETKLISLILFRLLHDDTIEDFSLGSNLDDIGAFDDICLKIKIAGRDRPVVVFVQVKHKDNDDKCLSLDNKSDAVKWCDSILKIKTRKVSSKSTDKIFGDDIDATDYLFVLYTNANCDFVSKNKFESNYATSLNNLMSTNDIVGLRPINKGEHVKNLGENILEADLSCLAEHFANFLKQKDKQSMNILHNEYMQRYHVILRQKVVNVSDIQIDEHKPDLKWRIMTFRRDFFDTSDKFLVLFKNHLYEQIIKKRPKFGKTSDVEPKLLQGTTPDSSVDELISAFFSEPSAVTLSPLIVTHITCDINGKLVFVSNRSENVKRLKELSISSSTINEAKAIAAKNKLISLKLKVPIAFGSIDLAINGSPTKIEKRLNHLTNAFVNICQNYTQTECYKVVTIDDTIDAGILSPNGGLASAVGNILVYDISTKLFKFSNDASLLENNAKALFAKLKHKMVNFLKYRFEVNTSKFPKLSLDCTDIAKEFLSKLVIYPYQANQNEVENILKREIQNHYANLDIFSGKSDSVFLYFHNEIQKWWMAPKSGSYLTKTSDIYVQAINNIATEPQISMLQNMFYLNNLRYLSYRFSENTMKLFELQTTVSKLAIVTDISTLTILKTIQCIKSNHTNTKYAVIDFECILKLPTTDFCALDAELRRTEKVVIIVCCYTEYNVFSHIKLSELAAATKEKHVIVITNDEFLEAVKAIFVCTDHVLYDKIQSLVDMTPKTQQDIISNSKVMFQESEVGLNLLVDDESIAFVKGTILNKIIHNQAISIGRSLSNPNYDEIKHLYVDRIVTEVSYDTGELQHVVRTFNDINDDAVLITSAPGMGKSTLLTHLAVETNKYNSKLWIIRMNLLDYSKQFYKWQKDNTVFNTLETLTFMCQVILKSNNISIKLKEINNEVFLEGCTGDELATFELNIFLRFYNKRRLIFLFDGFDEICPHYKNKVINFLNTVRNYPQQNKMWVTSRPYSDILPDLQKVLGKYFVLEVMSDKEQETYLINIWQTKLKINELNDLQLKTLLSFIDYIPKMFAEMTDDDEEIGFGCVCHKIYYTFYIYVLLHLPTNIRDYILQSHNVNYPSDSEPDTIDTDTLKDLVARILYGTFSKDPEPLLGTPLLLYFIADYFVNIVDTYQDTNKFQLDMNIFAIYEMFINNKLKKIQFQDKNKMDVYNPDIMMKYEKERDDCLTMHKKLAAFNILGRPIFSWLHLEEFKLIETLNKEEFDTIIYKIKTGEEKSGLISHVTADDEPVFIHRTFAEYFVVEFLCDILKSDKFTLDIKKLLYGALFEGYLYYLLSWIIKKSEIDDNLGNVIEDIKNKQPMYYRCVYRNVLEHRDCLKGLSQEQRVRLWSSTEEDYEGEFLDKYINDVNTLSNNAYNLSVFTIYDDVKIHFISKMKPHLKKYFI